MRSLFRIVRNRRRTFAIGVALVVGFITVALYLSRSRLTVEAYERIRFGMSLAEVEVTLCVNSGDFAPPPNYLFIQTHCEYSWWPDRTLHTSRSTGPVSGEIVDKATGEVIGESRSWVDGDHMILVVVRDGCVVGKSHGAAMPLYEIWFRQLMMRLGF